MFTGIKILIVICAIAESMQLPHEPYKINGNVKIVENSVDLGPFNITLSSVRSLKFPCLVNNKVTLDKDDCCSKTSKFINIIEKIKLEVCKGGPSNVPIDESTNFWTVGF